MLDFSPADHPHRRYNPLTGDWILVSPHRAKRPWQGQLEKAAPVPQASYDSSCYLCPGNTRINGEVNPAYADIYIFPNDFPALLPSTPEVTEEEGLFRSSHAHGTCRVICFSPDHSKTMPRLSEREIVAVIDAWSQQTAELGQDYQWVQVFENKGAMMGCSNPHPHGQIWATDFLPNEARKENQSQYDWLQHTDSNLLLEYALAESACGERVVVENDRWIAVVPYWAGWPFETLVLPKRHIPTLMDLDQDDRVELARLLKRLTTKYDNLFNCSFPYSMGWHGAPFGDEQKSEYWQLHAHFYPPLLRSETVRKFMVGFEMLAESQRDLTPEQAAEYLRNSQDVHYLETL